MEISVEKKLSNLLKLQKIDSALDSIRKVRGDLPEEVRDLEDDIAGFETRITKYDSENKALEEKVVQLKNGIKEAEKLIKKYEEQQMKVRNNREYDAITKEMELQQLEIQICEKKIKEAYHNIELKKKEIEDTQLALEDRKKDLVIKQKELDSITSESQDDEDKLLKDREKAEKSIEERLLYSYNRIRNNVKNGLAIVTVQREACGGCFNIVPAQRQADVRDKKKIIVCEHCGRILADVDDIVYAEEEKPKKRSASSRKKEAEIEE